MSRITVTGRRFRPRLYLVGKKPHDTTPSFGLDALILIGAGALAIWFYTQMVAAGS